MKYGRVATITLVILGIGGFWWTARRPAGPTDGPEPTTPVDLQSGLVGYWKLQGDCRDHSGNGHHGTEHGAGPRTGSFDGRGAHVEVPAGESLRLGRGD